MKKYNAVPLCSNRFRLGESPFYDSDNDSISFVDIIAGRFYSGNATKLLSLNNEKESFDFSEFDAGQMIGAAVPARNAGEYVLAATDGLYLYQNNEKRLICSLTEYFESYHRCNDAKADPKGRLFFGSSVADDDHGTSGNLYVYDINAESKIRVLQKDTKIANGMAWSKDNTKFYFSDSEYHAIFEYEYDYETGNISNRKVLFEIYDGSPDGMCIDANDNLWVAVWGGKRIECHSSANGELLATIDVDANNVTSCCFLGKSNQLFITTSGEGNDGKHDGCIFTCKVDEFGVQSTKANVNDSKKK